MTPYMPMLPSAPAGWEVFDTGQGEPGTRRKWKNIYTGQIWPTTGNPPPDYGYGVGVPEPAKPPPDYSTLNPGAPGGYPGSAPAPAATPTGGAQGVADVTDAEGNTWRWNGTSWDLMNISAGGQGGAPTDWQTKGNVKYSPSTGQTAVWDGAKWLWWNPKVPGTSTLSPDAAATAAQEAGLLQYFPGGPMARGGRWPRTPEGPSGGGPYPGTKPNVMPGYTPLGQSLTPGGYALGSEEWARAGVAAVAQRKAEEARARAAGRPQFGMPEGWQGSPMQQALERRRAGRGTTPAGGQGSWPTMGGPLGMFGGFGMGRGPGAPGTTPTAPVAPPAPAPRPVPPPITGYQGARMLPTQLQGLQGYTESLGIPWADYLAASQRLSPQWGMPEEAQWGAARQY